MPARRLTKKNDGFHFLLPAYFTPTKFRKILSQFKRQKIISVIFYIIIYKKRKKRVDATRQLFSFYFFGHTKKS